MKRRHFLAIGSIGMLQTVCAGLGGSTLSGLSQQFSAPVEPTPFQVTLTPVSLPTQPTASATVTEEATATGTPQVVETVVQHPSPIDDDFNNPTDPARTISADSAGQISFSDGVMQIDGTAPAKNDPSVYAKQLVEGIGTVGEGEGPAGKGPVGKGPVGEGLMVGARWMVTSQHESGNIGLATGDGQAVACFSRKAAEAMGGVITYGGHAFPVLNVYSQCWYDFVVFRQAGRIAAAINDGAGLELVLVGEDEASGGGYLGYFPEKGMRQGVRIDAWYAFEAGYFPPALINQANAVADDMVELGTNAAWVETQITRVDGNAGLRIRSVDRHNEYRLYLDGTALKLEVVLDGEVFPLVQQDILYRDGAVLAARYNELTLTVYYDNQVCGIVNRKMSATGLIAGARTGIYSTHPGNVFKNWAAWPVALAVPEAAGKRLINARQVLCLGDSLTNADKAFGYQNQLRKQLGGGWVTIDAGISGQTTGQMRSRLESHLKRYRPEVIIVLGGTNDIDNSYSAETIQGNLQAIYQTARQAKCRVAALTIPPRGKSAGWGSGKQAVLDVVNDWIINQAEEVDFRINIFSVVEKPGTNCLQADYNGGDGIHLSPAGYALVADIIYQNIDW